MLDVSEVEELLERCMASNCDFAEIFEEEGTTESLSMLNSKLEDANQLLRAGIGIRLYKGVQSVYGYTNDTDMDSLYELVDDLRGGFGIVDKQVKIHLVEQTHPNLHPVQINPINASLTDKVDLMQRASDSAMNYSDKINKVSVGLSSVHQNVQISNSDGRIVHDTRIRTRMAVESYAQDGDNLQSGYEAPGASMGLEFFDDVTPESIGEEASRVAVVLLSAKNCPSGKMPVIIDNGFGGVIFHEACGHALEASSVSKNQSVFSNKLGTKIANDCVTAIDDGTIPNAWGSQNVDDEGNLQQKRVLIENGILKTYMVDRLNGRRMGMESTSSSRRQSYKFETTSRMTNTYIAAGNDDFDEMFVGIKRGLYAKKMGGGSVNPQTGEFNFAVNEGYLIEDGKISYPVKGASLIGNGADILFNIDRVGKDLKRGQGMCGASSGSIPTDVGQPAIRVSNITVGGTKDE
jgi:TldD protein